MRIRQQQQHISLHAVAEVLSRVRANTVSELVVTGLALGATAYSGVLGAKTAQGDGSPMRGATDPAPTTPPEVANAQKQLHYLQWALTVLTGTIVVLGAQQGERQRASQVASGLARILARRVAS